METKKEVYKLYDGKVLLEYYPDTHTYKVNDKIIYGVSSIVGIINKPALMYWAVNQCIDNLKAIWEAGKSYDEIEINNILETSKKIHTEKKNVSLTIGTFVHQWIEKYINYKLGKNKSPKIPVNKEIVNSIKAFLKWEKENKIKWLESERKLYSVKYEYAGTLDAEAIVNNKLSIIDFKTSNEIYDENLLQVSAYLYAREEETKQDYKNIYIVRIGKNGELETRKIKDKELKDCFKAFLGCLEVYKWQMKIKDEKIKYLNNNKNISK